MNYMLLMFAGGVTGLLFSGPSGALFGLIAGFSVSAWEDLTGGVDSAEGGYSSDSYSPSVMKSFNDNHESVDTEFDGLNSWDDDNISTVHHINPATGLPMISDGIGGFDIAGNPYGIDWSSDDMHVDQMSGSEDMFSSSDPFS
jgi:hypothetical protein